MAQATVRDLGPAAPAKGLLTDGRRYVAVFAATGDAVAVRDLATGRRTMRRAPAGCRPTALGDGQLLVDCSPPPDQRDVLGRGEVIDLVSGIRRPLPEVRRDDVRFSESESADFIGIGRHWLRVHYDTFKYGGTTYLDRATGALADGAWDRTTDDDLDSPRLTRPFCEPIHRFAQFFPVGDNPLAIAGRLAAGIDLDDEFGTGPVVLQRCGRKPRKVRSCALEWGCSDVALGRRAIAWVERRGPYRCRFAVRKLVAGAPRGGLRLVRESSACDGLALVRDRLFAVADGRLLELST